MGELRSLQIQQPVHLQRNAATPKEIPMYVYYARLSPRMWLNEWVDEVGEVLGLLALSARLARNFNFLPIKITTAQNLNLTSLNRKGEYPSNTAETASTQARLVALLAANWLQNGGRHLTCRLLDNISLPP